MASGSVFLVVILVKYLLSRSPILLIYICFFISILEKQVINVIGFMGLSSHILSPFHLYNLAQQNCLLTGCHQQLKKTCSVVIPATYYTRHDTLGSRSYKCLKCGKWSFLSFTVQLEWWSDHPSPSKSLVSTPTLCNSVNWHHVNPFGVWRSLLEF